MNLEPQDRVSNQAMTTSSDSADIEVASVDITSQDEGHTPSTVLMAQQGSSLSNTRSSATFPTNGPLTITRRRSMTVTSRVGKWFELCVNYGEGRKHLGEIPLADIENDGQLFKEIRTSYESIRGSLIARLYLIKPVDINYVQVSESGRATIDSRSTRDVPH